MLITTGGVLIRTRVHEIREMGRNTQGVTLIQLGEGEKLVGLEKLVETEDDEPRDLEGNGGNGGSGGSGRNGNDGGNGADGQSPPPDAPQGG